MNNLRPSTRLFVALSGFVAILSVVNYSEAQSKTAPAQTVRLGVSIMSRNENRPSGFGLKSRLPSMYGNREAVDAGGLMSYGADLAESYRRGAYYVDRILQGTKPADLPV